MAAPETRDVRDAEQLDWAAMAEWLRARLGECGIAGLDVTQPMHVAQFAGGHSNLTYLIRFGAVELVVRRPPLGPVPPTAHDMAREFRWLSAVHPVCPQAPRAYLLCDNHSVVGSTFYVMERRRGTVIRHDEPPTVLNQPAMRRRLSEAAVDTLVALHGIGIEASGLMHLGKPAGFVQRQVRGWSERWHRSQTTPLPEMDALAVWLIDNLPPSAATATIVHGDFKLDNLMVDAADPGRVTAVLDWEMSALGDPLVDLGILLAYWSPAAPVGRPDALATVTTREGYLSPQEIVDRYAEGSGRDLTALRYFEVFSHFKIAVVIQQIYHRFVRGQTDDPRFAGFGDRVAALARQAVRIAER